MFPGNFRLKEIIILVTPPLPGAQLRYFIYAGEQVVALTGFGAAAWQTASRDQFVGWNHAQRKKNLHLITNNARFLLLPWVKSKNKDLCLRKSMSCQTNNVYLKAKA